MAIDRLMPVLGFWFVLTSVPHNLVGVNVEPSELAPLLVVETIRVGLVDAEALETPQLNRGEPSVALDLKE